MTYQHRPSHAALFYAFWPGAILTTRQTQAVQPRSPVTILPVYNRRLRSSVSIIERLDNFGHKHHQLLRILLGRSCLTQVLPVLIAALIHPSLLRCKGLLSVRTTEPTSMQPAHQSASDQPLQHFRVPVQTSEVRIRVDLGCVVPVLAYSGDCRPPSHRHLFSLCEVSRSLRQE